LHWLFFRPVLQAPLAQLLGKQLREQLTDLCQTDSNYSLFVQLVADGWCGFVVREKYCWLIAGAGLF
jgi:hypothetical protein